MKKISIIFVNDTPKAAVPDHYRAEEIMKELSREDYKRSAYAFESFDAYQIICYWHIHEVDILT